MDGMNYQWRELPLRDSHAAERTAFRSAIVKTLVAIVVVLGAVVALAEAGYTVPVIDEFQLDWH